MARKCTICKHKSRNDIDRALVVPGASIRGIARTYRVSEDALTRHVNNGHIAQKIQAAQVACEKVEANILIERVLKLQKQFEDLLERARKIGDIKWEIDVLKEYRGYLELEGKITGAFKERREQSGSLTLRFDREDEAL